MENPSTSSAVATTATRRGAKGQWFTTILTLAAGVLLIAFHNHLDLITWIVEGMGWFIILTGAYLIVNNMLRPRDERLVWPGVLGVFALGIGLWIAITPSTFANLLIYIFAAVLILAGIWNMFTLRIMGRTLQIPLYYYILPALVIVAGVCFLITGAKVVTTAILLVMGIALVVSVIATLAGLLAKHK